MQPFEMPSSAIETVAAAFLAESNLDLTSTVFSSLDRLQTGDWTIPPILSWAEIELYRARISSPARLRAVFPTLLERHQVLKEKTACEPSGLHGQSAPSLLLTAQLAFDAVNLSLMAHALRLIRPEIELRTAHIQLHDAANAAFWNPETATYTCPEATPWLLLARIATPERALLLFPEDAFATPSKLPPLDDCLALLEGLHAFCLRKQAASFASQLHAFLENPDTLTARAPFPYTVATLLWRTSQSPAPALA